MDSHPLPVSTMNAQAVITGFRARTLQERFQSAFPIVPDKRTVNYGKGSF